MSKNQDKYCTPPMVSVFPVPEPIKLARQRPPKMRFTERLSTPNVAVLMRSPNISPIPTSSIRTLDFESTPLKNKNNMDGMDEPLKTPTFGTPMEKSFRCPLNDHLDLKLILTEFDLGHLEPVFESNAITIAELSEMKGEDFMNLGIFKLNELDKLKRICNLVNDSQNASY